VGAGELCASGVEVTWAGRGEGLTLIWGAASFGSSIGFIFGLGIGVGTAS